jgi:hypothetical protein
LTIRKPAYVGETGAAWLFLMEKFVHFSDIEKTELVWYRNHTIFGFTLFHGRSPHISGGWDENT